jgi:hypothetical protein
MKTKETRKTIPGNILAEGEVTGHAHRVTVSVYQRAQDPAVREFDGATTVTHEEHKPIVLPKKRWASAQVIEFDHLSEMARPVAD